MTQRHSIERDTDIIPDAVADAVADEVVMALNEPELLDRAKLIRHLVKRACDTYDANPEFRTKVRSRASRGNAGRDRLRMFMRHWAAGFLYKQHPLSMSGNAFQQLANGTAPPVSKAYRAAYASR